MISTSLTTVELLPNEDNVVQVTANSPASTTVVVDAENVVHISTTTAPVVTEVGVTDAVVHISTTTPPVSIISTPSQQGPMGPVGPIGPQGPHTSAAGTEGQIQFNSGGEFAGKDTTGSGNVVLATSPMFNNSVVLNNTDASATTAKILDLQVGGVSKFNVQKDGTANIAGITFDSVFGNITRNGDIVVNSGATFIIRTGGLDRVTVDSAGGIRLSPGSGILEQRNGTTPQLFNLYNTYTDASNKEQGFIGWVTNVLTIGTGASGTGVSRSIAISAGGTSSILFTIGGSVRWRINPSGYFTPEADNVYDLGTSLTRAQTGYFGTGGVSITDASAWFTPGASGGALYLGNVNGSPAYIRSYSPTTRGSATELGLQFGYVKSNGTQATGLQMDSSGHLTPGGDNLQDFGATATRWRNGYFGGGLQIAGTPTVGNLTLSWDSTGGYIQTYSSKPLYLNANGNAVVIGSGTAGLRFGLASGSNLINDDNGVQVGLRNGAIGQQFNIYGSYTDSGNYQRLELLGNSGSYSRINAAKAGTGTNLGLILNAASHIFAINGTSKWQVDSNGHFAPYPNAGQDNAFDIGLPNFRPRNGYFGSSLYVNAAGANGVPANGVPSMTIYGPAGLPAYAGEVRFQSLDGTSTSGQILVSSNGLTFSTGTTTPVSRWAIDRGIGHFIPQSTGLDLGQPGSQIRNIHSSGGLYAYSAYTDNANYQRLRINTSGNSQIATEALGAFSATDLFFLIGGTTKLGLLATGNAQWYTSQAFATDITYDIGSSTSRARTVNAQSFQGLQVALTPNNSTFAYITGASDLSNCVELQNGTNPNTLRLYGTKTDTANYERMVQKYVSTGTTPGFALTTESAGTGTARDLVLSSATGTVQFPGTVIVGRGSSAPMLLVSPNATAAAYNNVAALQIGGTNVGISYLQGYGGTYSGSVAGVSLASATTVLANTGSLFLYSNGFDVNILNGLTTPSWQFKSTGHFLAGADNTFDIGQSGTRVRNGYFSGSIFSDTGFDLFKGGPGQYGTFISGTTTSLKSGGNIALNVGGVAAQDIRSSIVYFNVPISGVSNVLDLRNGTLGQTLRIYNTYTDAANYERGTIGWSANGYFITTEAAGTGAVRNLLLQPGTNAELFLGANNAPRWKVSGTTLTPHTADNTSDLGTASTRIRTAYVGSIVYIGDAGTGGTSSIWSETAGYLSFATNGTAKWKITDTGHLFSQGDSTFDIGASASNRPRSLYLGSDLVATGQINVSGGGILSSGTYANNNSVLGFWQSAGNLQKIQVNTSTGIVLASDRPLMWCTGTNAASGSEFGLYRGAAHTMEQRGGLNPQTFKLYNTYTDAANNEVGSIGWVSGTFTIGTSAIGTGTLSRGVALNGVSVSLNTSGTARWLVSAAGHLTPGAEGVYDIASTGNRVRSAYFKNVDIGLDSVGTWTTTNVPALIVRQGWNNAALNFDGGIYCNITDGTSGAASKLLHLQLGGVSKFYVDKSGNATASTSVSSPRYNATPISGGIGYFMDDGGGAANSYLAVYRASGDWLFASSKNNTGVAKNITFAVNSDVVAGAELSISDNLVTLGAPVRAANYTVATLPAASAALNGAIAYVTDSTLAFTGANIGTAVVGGSTNHTPVRCVNSVWVIG